MLSEFTLKEILKYKILSLYKWKTYHRYLKWRVKIY